MADIAKIIELTLEKKVCPTPEELASVSRAEGTCALCRLEDDAFLEYTVPITETSAENALADPVAAQIAARATAFYALTFPARYNFFSVEAGTIVARFMSEMGDIPYGTAVIVVPHYMMDDTFKDELCRLGVEIVDVEGITLNSSGIVIWHRPVPERLAKHLRARRDLEDYLAVVPWTALSLTPLTLEPYRTNNLPFVAGWSSYASRYSGRFNTAELADEDLAKLADQVSFSRFRLPPKPDAENYDPERWGWICSHGRFPDIDQIEDFDIDPYWLLSGSAKLWHTIVPAEEDATEFFFSKDGRAQKEAEAAGIDSAVEALYAGVPIDDILV